VRIGPLGVRRQWDGLLVGPSASHPSYGASYREERLPVGLTPEGLEQYVGRMSWYHEIDLGDGVLTPGMCVVGVWRSFGLLCPCFWAAASAGCPAWCCGLGGERGLGGQP